MEGEKELISNDKPCSLTKRRRRRVHKYKDRANVETRRSRTGGGKQLPASFSEEAIDQKTNIKKQTKDSLKDGKIMPLESGDKIVNEGRKKR